MWLAVNHKPVVKDTSHGMWRRVHFVPFGVTFAGKQINKRLVEELLEEAEGILAWLVRGCIAWYRNGRLTVPEVVQAATLAYREEMDVVARFLSDECVLGPDKKVATTQLLARYEAWCVQHGERSDVSALRTGLREKGYQSKRGAKGVWTWHGFGLIDHEGDPGDGGDGEFEVFSRKPETSQKSPNAPSPTVTSVTHEQETSQHREGGDNGNDTTKKDHGLSVRSTSAQQSEQAGDGGDGGDGEFQVFPRKHRTSQKSPHSPSPTATQISSGKDGQANHELMATSSGPLPTVHEEPFLHAKQDELSSTCVVCDADVEHYSALGIAYCEEHWLGEEIPS